MTTEQTTKQIITILGEDIAMVMGDTWMEWNDHINYVDGLYDLTIVDGQITAIHEWNNGRKRELPNTMGEIDEIGGGEIQSLIDNRILK